MADNTWTSGLDTGGGWDSLTGAMYDPNLAVVLDTNPLQTGSGLDYLTSFGGGTTSGGISSDWFTGNNIVGDPTVSNYSITPSTFNYDQNTGSATDPTTGINWQGLGAKALDFLTKNFQAIASTAGGVAAYMQANGAKQASPSQSIADQYNALYNVMNRKGYMNPITGVKPIDRMRVDDAGKFIPPANKAEGGLAQFAQGGVVNFAKGGLAEKSVRTTLSNILGRSPTQAEIDKYTGVTTTTLANGKTKTSAAYTAKTLEAELRGLDEGKTIWGDPASSPYTGMVAANKGYSKIIKDKGALANLEKTYRDDLVKYSGYTGKFGDANWTKYWDAFKAYRPEVATYLEDQYLQSKGGVQTTGATKEQQTTYDKAIAAAIGWTGPQKGVYWEAAKKNAASNPTIAAEVKKLQDTFNKVTTNQWDIADVGYTDPVTGKLVQRGYKLNEAYKPGHVDEFPKDGFYDDDGKPVPVTKMDTSTKTPFGPAITNADGTTTQHYTDGSSITTNKDGTQTQVAADGTTSTYGQIKVEFSQANADGTITEWYLDANGKPQSRTRAADTTTSAGPSMSQNIYKGDVTKYGEATGGGEHQFFNITNPLPTIPGSMLDPSVTGANQPMDPWHNQVPTTPTSTTPVASSLGSAIQSGQAYIPPSAPATSPVTGWNPAPYLPPAIQAGIVDPNAPVQHYANGGPVWQTFNDGIIPGAPQTYERGGHVQGPGTGQSDDINAKLSDGEYVIDADTVSALGDGSTQAGASALDQMRMEIRKHKRSAPAHKIPPKAKPAMAYLKKGKKGRK